LTPPIEVRGLSKRYGDVLAVDDVSFALTPGSITGFLGPNGAGKTTTLRLLLGLAEPSAGRALIFGRRYRELGKPMHLVGPVLESGDFDPGRTGRDHLRVLALAAELPLDRVDDVLDIVGLRAGSRRRVRTYSLGMRQRLSLAAALLGDPRLLVLDEPANGLDPEGVHWLRTFLRDFARRGGTVLVSSHVLAEIAQTVDRVIIISRGRVAASAALDELTNEIPRRRRTRPLRQLTLEDVYLDLTREGAR
jgi:ABC-2 type transport system ATP-binding protein